MSHSGELNHDQSEPHHRTIAIGMILITCLLILIIIGSIYYYEGTSSAILNKNECVTQQDCQKDVVQTPMDDAMNQVIQAYQKKQK